MDLRPQTPRPVTRVQDDGRGVTRPAPLGHLGIPDATLGAYRPRPHVVPGTAGLVGRDVGADGTDATVSRQSSRDETNVSLRANSFSYSGGCRGTT